MAEDLIVKTLTGLILEQKSMTENLNKVVSVQKALAQASARQEERYGDLLSVMQQFAQTSADTRQRLAALEADVQRLKSAS